MNHIVGWITIGLHFSCSTVNSLETTGNTNDSRTSARLPPTQEADEEIIPTMESEILPTPEEPEMPAVVKPLGLYVTDTKPGCTDGNYITHKGMCYAWFSSPFTQRGIKGGCSEYAARPLTVETREKFEFLPSFIQQWYMQKRVAVDEPNVYDFNPGATYTWWVNIRTTRGSKDTGVRFYSMVTGKELSFPASWVSRRVEVPHGAEWGAVIRVRFLVDRKFSLKLEARDPVNSPTWGMCEKASLPEDALVQPEVRSQNSVKEAPSQRKPQKQQIATQNIEKPRVHAGEESPAKDFKRAREEALVAGSKQTNMEGSHLSQSIVNENNIGESGDQTLMMIVAGGGLMCIIISTVFVCFWGSQRRNSLRCAPVPPSSGTREKSPSEPSSPSGVPVPDRPEGSRTPTRSPSPRVPDIVWDPTQLRKALGIESLKELDARVWSRHGLHTEARESEL